MSELAYLVIREGAKWSDVFRLVPGQAATIGRAPTCQIVLKDDRCSRNHVEVFFSGGQWVLRDLDSRNGTMIGSQRITGDHLLHAGDIIRIGRSQLIFVHTLADAFSDASSVSRNGGAGRDDTGTVVDDAASVLDDIGPTTITHRKGQTRFLEPVQAEEPGVSKIGRAAAKLCRLAFELAQAPDVAGVAQLALDGLAEGTLTDAGAVMLLPNEYEGPPKTDALEVIASRSSSEHRYHRLPHTLAETVIREGEAVLARNVMGDSSIGSRDSQGEIRTTSVICAPIRRGGNILGLIHLYSIDPDRVPDPDDLEFTLAVADTVAVALGNLKRREELAENLTQVRTENVQLRERLGVQSQMVGKSPVVRQVADEIARAAASNATVLIRGESGVGKELVARGIHNSSPRRDNVFVCAELRGAIGRIAGQRAVRPRARGLHRRHGAEDRQVRGGPSTARSCSTKSAR